MKPRLGFPEGGKKEINRKYLFFLFIFSFLIRIPLLIYPEVIHVDGVLYVRHARQILSWDWSVGRTHPFYPSLIALFHFLTPTDEVAGIWVSVIFGALLILPVFYLGKTFFNERVGLLAALFATVHPFLYTPSGSVLSESTFHFLLAMSVLFGWYAFQRGRFKDSFLFGLLASLSYLTRPEGIGFLLVFGGWVLLVNPPGEKRPWSKRAAILLLACIFFLVFSFPYFQQLKKDTGRWQISNKIAISMGSLSAEEASDAVERIRETKKITFSSFIKSPFAVAKKIGAGTLKSLFQFQQVFNPLLTVILVWGLLLSKGRSLSLKGESLCAFVYCLSPLYHSSAFPGQPEVYVPCHLNLSSVGCFRVHRGYGMGSEKVERRGSSEENPRLPADCCPDHPFCPGKGDPSPGTPVYSERGRHLDGGSPAQRK